MNPTDGDRARILVVDDTRVNRLVLEARLAKAGYEVMMASGGAEAVELLGLEEKGQAAADGFDAVVLDIMMPHIDGLQVLERVRAVRSANELPVIMATTKDQSEDIVKALELGANDYVTKPIDIPVLLARLKTQVTLRRTHLALKLAQRSLIEAARMESVGYLAAGVAHEVRNPLAQIQMGVDALKASAAVKADADLQVVIPIITEAVVKADNIINDLMKVSTTGEFELKPGSVNDVMRDALGAVEPKAKEVGVELEIELAEGMPAVAMAPLELRQVFSNVLANAIEAMPEGGRLTVRTRPDRTPQIATDEGTRGMQRLRTGELSVLVEILDTGTGIPADVLPSIFDPFFTTKPTGQATGLGLSLVRKMVHLHHGLMRVENREDSSGVRFTCHLPVVKA